MTGGMTLSDQLARHARKIPEQVALRYEGSGLTYRVLDERVSRLADALRCRGIRTGDRVAVMALNGTEVVESYLACVRLGAICVPVNFRLVADEIAHQLADCGAVAAVTDPPSAAALAAARAKVPEVTVCLVTGDRTEMRDAQAGGPGAESYEAALRDADPAYEGPVVDESSPAFIMYTSGTTGRPKGAVLTHTNLFVHTVSNLAFHGVLHDDAVWLAAAPLFHIAGMSGILPYLLRGGTTVIAPSGRFDPAQTIALLERERVSACFFVPSQWQALCAVPGVADRDLSALRRVSWGAAPASTTLIRTMLDTFPEADVLTSFGQTECCPITCALRGPDALRKIGSIGTPMLNVEVRVVDEEMRDVPRGEAGEIVYRGPTVMSEYWNRPEETREAFTGGWFHSGDLVREDEEGYFYLVDRKKDMIISGGENIYCAEVEDVLAAHPQVAEVALIGVPDPRWGETPLAVIVPYDPADPPTDASIETWCRARLAAYKRPRHLALSEALPRNPSGKVLKTRLRTEYAAGASVTDRAV